MKYLMIIFSLLFSSAQAQEVTSSLLPVPAYLRNAVITVTLTNGKVYTFSANEYAVVRRGSGERVGTLAARASKAPRHSLRLYAGAGSNGLKSSSSGNSTTVEQDYDFNLGIGYGHMLDEEWSLEGAVFFNKDGANAGFGGLGYHW